MAGEGVRVRLLGPVDVTVDGIPRTVSGLRRKAVLAVLGLHPGELVSTSRIIEAVWGQTPPAVAANALQSHVSYLRGVLGTRSAIVARPPGYVLDVSANATDVALAGQLIHDGAHAANPAHGAASLRAALALWRGRSLADVTDVDSLIAHAERLETLRLDGVAALVEARLALGEHAELVPELEQMRAEHPFREHLHRQLMLALYRSGRQAEALAAYQHLRRTLAKELGLDPSPALRELEAAILRQDSALDPTITVAEPSGSPAPSPNPVPVQLPLGVPAFAAREIELAELDILLPAAGSPTAGSPVSIAVVSGGAGIGKTALAVHWAHRVASQFPDGQLYVNLRGFDPGGCVMEPSHALRSFLEAFGVAPDRMPAGVDGQAGLYRGILAGKRVLVLLDNARDEEQVRPLLPAAPGCLVLVTSRRQLAGLVASEGAQPLSLALPSAAQAREMLTRRIGMTRVAAEPEAVQAIIARCARLPLALAVAAARAATNPGLPLAALATQLHDSAAALDQFDGGDPATDVRAVFSWSYRTLSPDAARLFRLLGLSPGPDIALAAVASLAGLPPRQVRAPLAELTRGHLLTEDPPGRYRFHDLLRAYAMEQAQLHDSDEERFSAQHRLLDYYLHSAHSAATLLSPLRDLIALTPPLPGVSAESLADRDGALAWIDAEYDTLLAVVTASAPGFERHIWQLASELTTYLDWYGCLQDNVAVQDAGLNAARRLGDRHALAYAHRGLGLATIRLDRLADADHHNRQALRLFEEIGDRVAGARAQLNLAWISERRGDFAGALNHSRLALRPYQSTTDRHGLAHALNNLGWCHAHLGEHAAALASCRQALALFRESGDRHGEASTWDSLGYVYSQLGDAAQTVACYDSAITAYQEVGDQSNEADTYINLGDGYAQVGDDDAARRAWQQAATVLGRLNHPPASVRVRLSARLGQPVESSV